MARKSKRGYARERVIKNINGKDLRIRISPKDWEHFKVPKTNLEHVRPQFFEYLGALVGRASHNKENGYLIRRIAPRHSDLDGRYLKLHKKLFGREPSVQMKPDGSHDVRVNSRATYEYLIKAWGFNPKAKTKSEVLSEPTVLYLSKPENSRERRAFLTGFFNTHLKSRYNQQQSLDFFFFFNHQNIHVSDFISDLAEKEGIRITGKSRKRFISSKKSKIRAVKLLENPYEQAKLVIITSEGKGFGEKQPPEKIFSRLKKTNLKNMDPELRKTGILEKVEKNLKKGIFDPMREMEDFHFRLKCAKISAGRQLGGKKKRAGLSKSKLKSKQQNKPEKILERIPPEEDRRISFNDHWIDPEEQVFILNKCIGQKKNGYVLSRGLRILNSQPGLMEKVLNYSKKYHPEKKKLIKLLQESQKDE